jgi:hypothetical protein
MRENSTTHSSNSGVWHRGEVIKVSSLLNRPIANFPHIRLRVAEVLIPRGIYIPYHRFTVEVHSEYLGLTGDQTGVDVILEQSPTFGIFHYFEPVICNV